MKEVDLGICAFSWEGAHFRGCNRLLMPQILITGGSYHPQVLIFVRHSLLEEFLVYLEVMMSRGDD
jgi:hypothetical protein